ncbi:MAG TPA: D-Ala-D-Ala carboxypeptidase family metallohydrolase [Candidatus Lokiarchaeia archaeon]
MYLTTNFNSKEFACKCGCGKDNINIALVNRLQVLRDIINEPITITSGCRCVKHNNSIPGSAPNSNHLLGIATDFTCESIEKLAKLLENWSGGFHYYFKRKFIHIDIAHRSRWTGE